MLKNVIVAGFKTLLIHPAKLMNILWKMKNGYVNKILFNLVAK
jgi:hypothetical protein